jgi:hypothetical protein
MEGILTVHRGRAVIENFVTRKKRMETSWEKIRVRSEFFMKWIMQK